MSLPDPRAEEPARRDLVQGDNGADNRPDVQRAEEPARRDLVQGRRTLVAAALALALAAGCAADNNQLEAICEAARDAYDTAAATATAGETDFDGATDAALAAAELPRPAVAHRAALAAIAKLPDVRTLLTLSCDPREAHTYVGGDDPDDPVTFETFERSASDAGCASLRRQADSNARWAEEHEAMAARFREQPENRRLADLSFGSGVVSRIVAERLAALADLSAATLVEHAERITETAEAVEAAAADARAAVNDLEESIFAVSTAAMLAVLARADTATDAAAEVRRLACSA